MLRGRRWAVGWGKWAPGVTHFLSWAFPDGVPLDPFTDAPFGIVGLETALALTLTHLVGPGHLTLARAVELWTDAPRRIFRLPEVTLEPGSQADLVLFDPQAEWVVDPEAFFTQGRNTPFAGWHVKGRVLATMLAGRFTHVASGLAFSASPLAVGASW